MVMKFRDHTDPLYFDPKANDKIFVPVVSEVSIAGWRLITAGKPD